MPAPKANARRPTGGDQGLDDLSALMGNDESRPAPKARRITARGVQATGGRVAGQSVDTGTSRAEHVELRRAGIGVD